MNLQEKYFKTLSVLYFIGFVLHGLDLFDLRLQFSEMNTIWKIWIVYLLIFDFVAAIGLWKNTRWGEVSFLLVAVSQLIAYVGFPEVFMRQVELIAFHIICLLIYVFVKFLSQKRKRAT